MDKAEIKRQISYWEAVEKDNAKRIKGLTEQNKQIKANLKFLRGLLGVVEEVAADDEVSPDEFNS